MKASAAAGDPSPPPPSGWLSGLVSGAGRLLAAVLDPESSASDTTSSSPESSQSPPRRDQDHDIGKCFPSDCHQLNLSGKEIVLKDSGEGSLAIVSEIDPKDAVKQLLMQETYSRSECDALIKIIQERVMDSDDEPAVILPIAWRANTQQHPVAYSSSPNTAVPAVSNPCCSPVFDNVVEKECLKKSSAVAKGPCTNGQDQIQRAVKRSYSNTGDTIEESRRIRPKQNKSNSLRNQGVDTIEESRRIRPKRNKSNSLRNKGASSKEATTNPTSALRGFPEDVKTLFKDIPLLGTNNLKFSDLASKGVFDDEPSAVAAAAQHFTSTSCQADWDKCGSRMSYPYSSQNQLEVSRVKAELLDEPVPLETDMSHLVKKNDALTVRNGSSSVSNKTVFQGDIEAAPSSSMALQTEKSSRNCNRGFNLQNCIPTKTRSPARRNRPSNNGNTVRSWNGPPQQRNRAAGQERGKWAVFRRRGQLEGRGKSGGEN